MQSFHRSDKLVCKCWLSKKCRSKNVFDHVVGKEDIDKITDILLSVPNIPNDTVPEGNGANDNTVEKMGGTVPELGENALPHWELAKKYNLIDFDLGVKITGATVHYVDEGTDTGRIIAQKAVYIQDGDTPSILQKRVMEEAEWVLLPKAINDIANR